MKKKMKKTTTTTDDEIDLRCAIIISRKNEAGRSRAHSAGVKYLQPLPRSPMLDW